MGHDRLGFALHMERFEFLADEDGPCVADHRSNGYHFAIVRLAEHAGCGVHRVAHQRVGASMFTAQESHEHPAGLDALAEHEW